MTRINKVVRIDTQLKNRCQVENAENIRLLLDVLLGNAEVSYRKVLTDHRYHQGYLQALDDLRGTITKS